jgi:hypothetical protein
MGTLDQRIGGYLSAASRLEKKARLLELDGCTERAEECRRDAAEHRALVKKLRERDE